MLYLTFTSFNNSDINPLFVSKNRTKQLKPSKYKYKPQFVVRGFDASSPLHPLSPKVQEYDGWYCKYTQSSPTHSHTTYPCLSCVKVLSL